MKLSIITVCRNAEKTIEDTIRSVLSQTYAKVEHIIVDGASKDATLDIVAGYGDTIDRIISEPDQGIYDAMNKGIALASGDVVGFLNSDDFYASPTVLETVARVMADPAADCCYGDLLYVNAADTTRIVRYWRSRPYERGLCAKGWMPAHPTFFVRRRIYKTYGGFDTQFRLQADFELTTRLLQTHEIRSAYIPEVLVHMRTGGATNRSLGNILRGNIEAYRACRKNKVAVGPLFIPRKILSRLPQYFARPPH